MAHQIDLSRLLRLVLLLGAGMFAATRLVRADAASPSGGAAPRRLAWRGMWGMTLLGFGSGLAGGLLEDRAGDDAVVALLHAIYRVCWTPAFWMRELEELLPRGAGTSLLGSLGLLLIPVFWFLLFFGAGHLIAWHRARGVETSDQDE